jgi:flagellar hook-associated protein 3 FlgL
MRVTDKMGYNQVTTNLQKNRLEMSDLQNQAATQKRINKPSDDPIAAARVLSARSEEKMNKQFLKNIDLAKSFLESSDQSLGELSENLMRAKELTIQAANDPGGGPETRRIAALEIEQIYHQAIQIGNRKLGERYIFAGYKTTSSPFTPQGNYMGDDGDMTIQISKDAFVPMNVPGNKVFLGQVGGANDSRKSSENPRVAEDIEAYKQNENQRMQQKQEQDEQAEVQVRGLASETNSRVPLHVGPKGMDYQTAGINVLETLKNLEIGLKVNDKTMIQEAIDNLDQSITQVVHTRAQVGSRLMGVAKTADTLQKQVIEDKITASNLEDADLFKVVSDMQKSESTLKATLETSGKVIQPSLLDFIR